MPKKSIRKLLSYNRRKGPPLATLKRSPHAPLLSPLTRPRNSGATAAKAAEMVSTQILSRLKLANAPREKDTPAEISMQISSILRGSSDAMGQPSSSQPDNEFLPNNILDIPWFSNMRDVCTTQRRKEVSRERKQKYVFKNTESHRFTKLMRTCVEKLGAEATLEVFGKLGRETGIKEYNAMIKVCINKARMNSNEYGVVHIHKAYQLLEAMIVRGFQIEEESYGIFFKYLIDMEMIEEFQEFRKLVKEENPISHFRIAYYEMLLWIRVGDEHKIRELCNSLQVASNEDNHNYTESYLLAFCESDRKKELLEFLEVLDISRVSSLSNVSTIFKYLGRLHLESFAVKFILALNSTGAQNKNISPLVYDYAVSLPNLAGFGEVRKAQFGRVIKVLSENGKEHMAHHVHEYLEGHDMYIKLVVLALPLRIVYSEGQLSIYLEVSAALGIADSMCKTGMDVPVETFQTILDASAHSYELEMVHPIYSVMCHYNVEPKGDTFKTMITMCMKMKDFESAYKLLSDATEIYGITTTSMYNAIMAGYFVEKNIRGAVMVLKEMEDANVKPDSETFSYLISNCECEENIGKYREELQHAGVQVTKHVHMALINAYANFGNFELAKQVVLDQELPAKYLNEIKSVLVSVLASNGQISDALNVYDEIKQAGCKVEPKAAISLIEHHQSEGELERLLQLLEELKDSCLWFDGCSRVVLYCAQYGIMETLVDLLKQLKEKDETSTYIVLDKVFSQVWEVEPTDLDFGFKLLQAVKDELCLHPSRTSLDFLLSTCVKAKDTKFVWLIWLEYEKAGISYNTLTSLRMYQALLASGQKKAASKMRRNITRDDPHVRYIIKSCQTAFAKP